MKLAPRLILEEALEAEARYTPGRDFDEHGAEEGRGYRNGHRTARLKTSEGAIDLNTPQIAGRVAPFRPGIRRDMRWPRRGARARRLRGARGGC